MLLYFSLFVIGLVLLIKGAHYLVDGSSSLAKKMGISNIVIGLTVVAFGTSSPELVVNLFAVIRGSTDMALGNIIGSNTANVLLILGISSVILPLTIRKGTTWREIPFAFVITIFLVFVARDTSVDRVDGLALISFLIIFLAYSFKIRKHDAEHAEFVKACSKSTSWLMIFGGLIALALGGKLIVDSSINIARIFNITETLIGLTIVAIGTSLPELATSVVAVYKKNADIAVGNIVGSNIFNLGFVLGISAIIRPLPFSPVLNSDISVAVFSIFALFVFMFIGKKHTLERWQGVVFLACYFAYIAYLVLRG